MYPEIECQAFELWNESGLHIPCCVCPSEPLQAIRGVECTVFCSARRGFQQPPQLSVEGSIIFCIQNSFSD